MAVSFRARSSFHAVVPIDDVLETETQPERPASPPQPQSFLQRLFKSATHLANLLPTGTLLVFQVLVPLSSNRGACNSSSRYILTGLLLSLLAVVCFLANFTDSYVSPDGQVHHGFATFKGMWLFDYQAALASCSATGSSPDLGKYRLVPIDWVHALLSVLVFASVALRDYNVTSCFFPIPVSG